MYDKAARTKNKLELEVRYARTNNKGITKSQLKNKCFSTPKLHAKKDPRRSPKNLQHLGFEDERCKHSTFHKKKFRD